ncbi:hypothetical protein XPN_1707, partial [Xanthomonas arboricola pv. pruni MAFF 301427]
TAAPANALLTALARRPAGRRRGGHPRHGVQAAGRLSRIRPIPHRPEGTPHVRPHRPAHRRLPRFSLAVDRHPVLHRRHQPVRRPAAVVRAQGRAGRDVAVAHRQAAAHPDPRRRAGVLAVLRPPGPDRRGPCAWLRAHRALAAHREPARERRHPGAHADPAQLRRPGAAPAHDPAHRPHPRTKPDHRKHQPGPGALHPGAAQLLPRRRRAHRQRAGPGRAGLPRQVRELRHRPPPAGRLEPARPTRPRPQRSHLHQRRRPLHPDRPGARPAHRHRHPGQPLAGGLEPGRRGGRQDGRRGRGLARLRLPGSGQRRPGRHRTRPRRQPHADPDHQRRV